MAQTKIKGTQVETFTSSSSGVVPSSGGGTTNFLRADGTWSTPQGNGEGDSFTFTSGTLNPSGGNDGDIYLQYT